MVASFAQIEPYLLQSESGGRPGLVSPTGAKGYYQFLDRTWRGIPADITQGYSNANQAPFSVQQAAANYLWDKNSGSDWLCAGCNATAVAANNAIVNGQDPGIPISQTVLNLPLVGGGGTGVTDNPTYASGGNTGQPAGTDGGGSATAPAASGSAGSGQQVNIGLQSSTVKTIGGWLTQELTTAVTNPLKELFGSAQNWFQRGFIMVIALVIVGIALYRLADPNMTALKTAVRAA